MNTWNFPKSFIMEYSKEFKQALSAFTSAEKDKLIFRLLRKDKILSQKLYFELIDPENTDDKREQMETYIRQTVTAAGKNNRNPKLFLQLIRKVSAKITEHVKITTDKFGEVSLNLMLIAEVLKHPLRHGDSYKLDIYLLNKVLRMLTLTVRLDPDYYIDLIELYKLIKSQITGSHQLKSISINIGLKQEWLDPDNVPENIADIYRDIKSRGLLR